MRFFLNNPMAARTVLAVVISVCLLALGAQVIRRLRRSLVAPGGTSPLRASSGNSTLTTFATYDGVIRQLREAENELKRQRQKERSEAAATENISETVLSHLSSGVVFFDRMGVVRQINKAAKSLLGYASPFLFHFRDLFRGVTKVRRLEGEETNSPAPLVQAMQQVLRDESTLQGVEVEYLTPGGQKRVFGITASAVRSRDGAIIGACCLIDDLTEITELSRQLDRNETLVSMGEISAGIAQDFKNSLALIAGYADQLLKDEPGANTRDLARKISAETESLTRVISEFLEFAKPQNN